MDGIVDEIRRFVTIATLDEFHSLMLQEISKLQESKEHLEHHLEEIFTSL